MRTRSYAPDMATYAWQLGLIPALFLVACTQTGHTAASPASSTPSPSTASSAAATLAPISIAAEPGRDIALPVQTGAGGTQLQVRPFKGRFELLLSCIGGGSATFSLGDSSSSIDCNGQLVGNEIETGKVADTLSIHAAGEQHWRVAVQTGHTPIG